MPRILEFPTLRPGYGVDLPACDEGKFLAADFIASCITALETDQSANFIAKFESYIRHRAECEKCNEV